MNASTCRRTGLLVHNTREVGTIRVVKHESKGRINKRLRIRVE